MNILRFVWADAFQVKGISPNRMEYYRAWRHVNNAGADLANLLKNFLGKDYGKPIHFIGHSLGTAVNAYAAHAFLKATPNVAEAQFTALDRPHHVNDIKYEYYDEAVLTPDESAAFQGSWTTQFENKYGFSSDFFGVTLQDLGPGLDLKIDNYYALDGKPIPYLYFGPLNAGVGDEANGATVYNYRADPKEGLKDPLKVGQTFFGSEGFANNHSGVHQWYRWTIDPNNNVFTTKITDPGVQPSFCYENEFLNHFHFDGSLNPCTAGWYWSLNGPDPNAFPSANGKALTVQKTPVVLVDISEYGCVQAAGLEGFPFTCQKHSPAFATAILTIPEDARFLSFEYRFSANATGDYAAVFLDGLPIWTAAGASFTGNSFVESGPIPVAGFGGTRTLTIILEGTGDPGNLFEIRNFTLLATGPNVTLNVTPPTDGTVAAPGIACPDDCSEGVPFGTTVSLTATPAEGFQVGAWIGCDWSSGDACTVQMAQARTVGVTFTQTTFPLTISPAPTNGRVVGPGIDCPGDCNETFGSGATVILRAIPASGYQADAWAGCQPTGLTDCAVGMNQARDVSVTFSQIVLAPPQISPLADQTLQEGTAYTGSTPSVTGTPPITWSLISEPSGITVNPTTGVVSWPSPTTTGSPHTITLRATNSAGSADVTWHLTVTTVVFPPGWSVTGNMAGGRSNHHAVLLTTGPNAGKVLVVGGLINGNGILATTQFYDPATGTWSNTGNMIHPREGHATALLANGKVLVTGGFIGPSGSDVTATAELYDPISGTWSSTGSMTAPRYGHSATLLSNGKVLVAGSYVHGTAYPLSSAELYDPATGMWSATGNMAAGRSHHGTILLTTGPHAGQVLVVGEIGAGSTILATAEVYNPATGSWAGTGSLTTGRTGHTATQLADGKVLVAGGGTTPSVLTATSSAEVYNPATGLWSSTGSLATPRAGHAAARLSDGRVLVAGGLQSDTGYLASAEIYEPGTGMWSSAGTMNTPRYYHTATLLPDGRVVVAGGQAPTMTFHASAELFALPSALPALVLQLNQSAFNSGQTLTLNATVTPGFTPVIADVYVALQLPNGSLLFLQGMGT